MTDKQKLLAIPAILQKRNILLHKQQKLGEKNVYCEFERLRKVLLRNDLVLCQ